MSGAPAFHRAIFVGERHSQIFGIFDYGSKDFSVLFEVALKAIFLVAKVVIVADKRTNGDIIGVATE